ncbi:MAG: hypothetical protein ABW157_14300 [Candidatus Thiodiazotropha sp. LLP2]
MNKKLICINKFTFLGVILLTLLYGCGGSTGGTKSVDSSKQAVTVSKSTNSTSSTKPTSSSAVSISNRIAYAAGSGAPDKVKAECVIDTQLPTYIGSFASQSDIAVVKKDGAVNKKAKGRVLALEISNVIGSGGGAWSGSKSVAVTGELFENGKKIGSFNGRRSSGGGFFGAYKGTCKILDRCVKALGKDIAIWLIDPTMDAHIGE